MKTTAEIALIRALPDMLESELKPGRLKNRMTALQALADRKLAVKVVTFSEKNRIAEKLEEFARVTGWGKKGKNTLLFVNFLLAVCEENSKLNQFIPVLNEIYDYYQKKPAVESACIWSGDLAFKKWEDLWNSSEGNLCHLKYRKLK